MSDAPAPAAGTPAAVQPGAPGQGEQDGGTGLYDLNAVPEQYREHVLPILKEIEGNATKKFTEAAEFRKQWEPYGQLGLQNVDPQELGELLQFREIAQDPEKFKEWYDAVGQELGFNDESQLDSADDFGDGMFDQKQVQQMIEEAVQKAVSPITEQQQAQQYEKAVADEQVKIETELDGLQEKHGEFNRQRVIQLALSYGDDPEAISKAHADHMADIADAEKRTLQSKMDAPAPPETGGRPDNGVAPITTFEQAKAAARDALRAASAT